MIRHEEIRNPIKIIHSILWIPQARKNSQHNSEFTILLASCQKGVKPNTYVTDKFFDINSLRINWLEAIITIIGRRQLIDLKHAVRSLAKGLDEPCPWFILPIFHASLKQCVPFIPPQGAFIPPHTLCWVRCDHYSTNNWNKSAIQFKPRPGCAHHSMKNSEFKYAWNIIMYSVENLQMYKEAPFWCQNLCRVNCR